MKMINRTEPWFLFLGDILVLTFSLWLSLFIRFNQIPAWTYFTELLFPFGILFLFWLTVFFIAGLYEKHTSLFKSRLPARIFNTQVFNSFLAVVFFYFVPYFGVTPKTILFIYIILSLGLVLLWRLYGQNLFGAKAKESALILASGPEMELLFQEVNSNKRYGFLFTSAIDLNQTETFDFERDVALPIREQNISIIVVDWQNKNIEKNLANFYDLLFAKVRFVDMNSLYEEIFDRVPLSLVGYDWFIGNLSLWPNVSYSILKRFLDIVFSLILGLLSLIFYPFIFLAIKLEDQGSIFIIQNRIGKNNRLVKIVKFRTMSFNDNEENNSVKNKITKVGAFLRKSRLDELPQLWNVLKGDLSLIGPRPELPALAKIYEKEVPHYNVRHLISPGLSGWAQLYHENHPHQGANTKETKNKLSYDLYYLKNRSLLLDLKIALKTIKTLLSQTGK